jgi:hypothetical protein
MAIRVVVYWLAVASPSMAAYRLVVAYRLAVSVYRAILALTLEFPSERTEEVFATVVPVPA